MSKDQIATLISLIADSLEANETIVKTKNLKELKNNVHKLTEVSALETGPKSAIARYLVRGAALDLGIIPASIHDLYVARGKGEVPSDFTVPAINLRVLPFDAARAVFRAAMPMNVGALIFEIARSEIGYTNQRPVEYATNILSAAIVEDYRGYVFLQGDHFQISPSRYANDAKNEVKAVKDLSKEAIHAGFYNIDVDTSTLVDLNKTTVPEQQEVNIQLSAEFTAYIRSFEPEGVTISMGGEIGEVGGHNSNEEELRAYMDGFNSKLDEIAPGKPGLSKISIQTGTSHGGVVLPDGSIAEVKVDFESLMRLSQVARDEYGMGGAVQHGASTLPQDAFGKFVEAEACEVHLATNFQNIFFDRAPKDMKKEIYAYLEKNHAQERKPEMTLDQFYYKSRKQALGPFKNQIWALPAGLKEDITKTWEDTFQQLFISLGVANTKKYIDEYIKAPKHLPSLNSYLAIINGKTKDEDASDLAD